MSEQLRLFGRGREEIQELERRIAELEAENLQLKHQLIKSQAQRCIDIIDAALSAEPTDPNA